MKGMRLVSKSTLAITALLVLSGCAAFYKYNPATEQKEFILFGTSQEINLGRSFATEIEAKSRISDDPALNAHLQRLGDMISAVSERTDLSYTFKVVENEKLNAFALPGGFVYVHSGLMKKLTDEELACVLAHEIGHIAAKHSIKRLQANMGIAVLSALASSTQKDKDRADKIAQGMGVIYTIISLGYSRADEYQADRLAVRYAHRAGVNPAALISVFEKLAKEEKNQYHFTVLSTHPKLQDRIENIRQEIVKIRHSVL